MKKPELSSLLLCVSALGLVAPIVASTPALADYTIADAIGQGKTNLELRYRDEYVDDETFADPANASTLRTRLRYTTGLWNGFSALTELDYVSTIGEDHYNSTRNGNTHYPKVADPVGGDLNQALLRFQPDADYYFALGREKLNIDNQRFIGSAGWRQNEQTFDAFTAEYKGISKVIFDYSYINRVHTVYGPNSGTPTDELDSDSHLMNVHWTPVKAFNLSAYNYLLDFKNAATSSNATIGSRATGNIPLGNNGLNFGYTAEFAHQRDYGNNQVHYSANYKLAELSFGGDHLTGLAGYESLGGDTYKTNAAFQTPLATLHIFQGFADKFLTTPKQGVIDSYAGANLKVPDWTFGLTAHQFRSEDGRQINYGSEVDASAIYNITKNYILTMKVADFNADAAAYKDILKAWLMFEAKY